MKKCDDDDDDDDEEFLPKKCLPKITFNLLH